MQTKPEKAGRRSGGEEPGAALGFGEKQKEGKEEELRTGVCEEEEEDAGEVEKEHAEEGSSGGEKCGKAWSCEPGEERIENSAAVKAVDGQKIEQRGEQMQDQKAEIGILRLSVLQRREECEGGKEIKGGAGGADKDFFRIGEQGGTWGEQEPDSLPGEAGKRLSADQKGKQMSGLVQCNGSEQEEGIAGRFTQEEQQGEDGEREKGKQTAPEGTVCFWCHA